MSTTTTTTATSVPSDHPIHTLLKESPSRFVLFPIKDMDVWNEYKASMGLYWKAEEVNLKDDIIHWESSLNDSERNFIKHVLAFFAASDGIVMENLVARFATDVQLQEARAFYAYQVHNEAIHSEMYGRMIEAYIKDEDERLNAFRAIETIPTIRDKADWAVRWIENSAPEDHHAVQFTKRLVAFACVEGIFFSSSFCAIFWLKKRGLMPGLCLSNEYISRDEGVHTMFACLLYRKYCSSLLAESTVRDIVSEAVDIETRYVAEALPIDLIGINRDSMTTYVRHVANYLMRTLGHGPLYTKDCHNPFPWMNMISINGKTNFFERKSSEYQMAVHREVATAAHDAPAAPPSRDSDGDSDGYDSDDF